MEADKEQEKPHLQMMIMFALAWFLRKNIVGGGGRQW
jgi:hypothetical protein